MSNEAFARVKIDAQPASPGWNTLDVDCVRYEVVLPGVTRADHVLCDRHDRYAGCVNLAFAGEPNSPL